MPKTTLVIGASLKETRYSNICVKTLTSAHYPVTALGLRPGYIDEVQVLNGYPELDGIHTITLYMSAQNQAPWYEYIQELGPSRVIFNPGTENAEFENVLCKQGIEVVQDCTIMMVQSGRY
ncbi:MAG: CoA-binding protein [Bacteroidota bacterium]